MIGILGILKAGGAYLPLDPNYPQHRLSFMLHDAQIQLLLTQGQFLKSIADVVQKDNLKVVCLDSDWMSISQQKKENPARDIQPLNLAFVVYTSGSTGNPKGVATTHANMCCYVQALQEALGIIEDDYYLHTASLSFSSSNRQLMLPFSQGSTIIMATSEDRINSFALFKLIKSDKVTIIDLVPSHQRSCIETLSQLEEESKKKILDNNLRLILSASEELLADIPQKWRKILKHKTKLVNMCGLTETTGIFATYEIPDNLDEKLKIVPIGSPIKGMDAYILDKDLGTVPSGEVGMLYVGGPNITRGYLNMPELSKDKFLHNPFDNAVTSRLFRTGDLSRRNDDGIIEYIGRSDYQIKIHGFRIEPKEIEFVLNKHPEIQESIVVAREFQGVKQLVAYFVPQNQNQPLTSTELRQFIQQDLPEYMKPSYFVRLSAFPLTPNGKIDRAALLRIDPGSICLDSDFFEPRTPVEKILIGIWLEVLGINRVGIFNNFFEIGGNSLLGYQIVSRIYDKFGINLLVTVLFEKSTVAELSEQIEKELLRTQHTYNFEKNRDKGKI